MVSTGKTVVIRLHGETSYGGESLDDLSALLGAFGILNGNVHLGAFGQSQGRFGTQNAILEYGGATNRHL